MNKPSLVEMHGVIIFALLRTTLHDDKLIYFRTLYELIIARLVSGPLFYTTSVHVYINKW